MSDSTTYLKVKTHIQCYTTRVADSTDRWYRDDTATSWELNHVNLSSEYSYWDVCVPFVVNPGDDVWIVAAVYSTGDSYGHDEGACIEYIDAFFDKHKARECARVVNLTRKDYHNHTEKKLEWTREDGSTAKLSYVPWNGYFESLDKVFCDCLEVKKD